MKSLTKEYIKLQINKKHVEVIKINIQNNEETIIFMRDITAIIEKEKNKTHDQMQSILLSSISHDLKTPINSILASN